VGAADGATQAARLLVSAAATAAAVWVERSSASLLQTYGRVGGGEDGAGSEGAGGRGGGGLSESQESTFCKKVFFCPLLSIISPSRPPLPPPVWD
jgi:hypothetical protein